MHPRRTSRLIVASETAARAAARRSVSHSLSPALVRDVVGLRCSFIASSSGVRPLDSRASTQVPLSTAPRDRQGRSRAQGGRSTATRLDDLEGRRTIDRVLARVDDDAVGTERTRGLRHDFRAAGNIRARFITGESLTIRDGGPPNLSGCRQCREEDNSNLGLTATHRMCWLLGRGDGLPSDAGRPGRIGRR